MRKGNCYEVHAEYVAEAWLRDPTIALMIMHGDVTGFGAVGPAERPHGHCWIEMGETVLDLSVTPAVEMPRQDYYLLGMIDESQCRRYTAKETCDKMVATGHYGPWDEGFRQ